MDEQMLLREFELLADAPDAIPKLREMILDLAVRGRLVPQDESDKPASELLRRIEAEKQRLYEKGRNRKPKKLPPVKEEEKPFELPQGWEWARLGDVAQLSIGKTPSTKNKAYWDGDIPWVSISDLDHYGIVHNTKRTITRKAADSVFSGEIAPRGSLLMSFKLTIGKVAWLGVDAYHNEAIVSIDAYDGLSESYLFRLLPHLSTGGKTRAAIKGKTLNKSSLSKLLIPVAPNAEQRRIVAKVDELMRLCDELESRQEKRRSVRVSLNSSALDALQKADREALPGHWQFVRDHFDLLYQDPQNVQKLKETILQLAVQGKLWGKQWDRVPLADLVAVVGGNTPSKQNASFWGGDIPWLSPKDIKAKHLWTAKDQITRKAVDHGGAKIVDPGAVLVVIRGMILAHTVPSSVLRVPAAINQDLKALTPSENLDAEFLMTALWACNSELLEVVQTSSHGTKRLPTEDLLSWHAPLPPINEQRRIVAKVDDLMRLCDELEGGLKRSEAKAEGLLEMVVREGVMTVGNTETASTR